MDETEIKHVVEAALLAAGRPLTLDKLSELFTAKGSGLERATLRAAIESLAADYEGRGIEINEVASGYRIQIKRSVSDWLTPLWEERAPRYTRALLETLALIAYRQPITRGEIEEVRGVAVSTNIMRTLMERGWIRVVGYRDVPGKPAMFGTTREFLDYFGLKRLEDLPPLAELKDGIPDFARQTDLIESLTGGEQVAAVATEGDVEAQLAAQEQAGAEPEPEREQASTLSEAEALADAAEQAEEDDQRVDATDEPMVEQLRVAAEAADDSAPVEGAWHLPEMDEDGREAGEVLASDFDDGDDDENDDDDDDDDEDDDDEDDEDEDDEDDEDEYDERAKADRGDDIRVESFELAASDPGERVVGEPVVSSAANDDEPRDAASSDQPSARFAGEDVDAPATTGNDDREEADEEERRGEVVAFPRSELN